MPAMASTLRLAVALLGALVLAIPGPAAAQAPIPAKITSPTMPTPAFVRAAYSHQVTVTGTEPIVVTAEGLPPGLVYDDTTRRVTGIPTQTGTFVVTLRATNGVAPPDAQVSTVSLFNPPLQILTSMPLAPSLPIGTPVSIPLEATGGLAPYKWDLVGGALPPGLALAVDGHIVGTPTTPGTFPFTARVRDVLDNFDSRGYQLSVGGVLTALKLAMTPNPSVAGQDVAVTATVEAVDAPPPPTGSVTLWIAGAGTRCPDPFESGPDPVTTNTRSVAVTAGVAQTSVAGLGIGLFRVCARFEPSAQYGTSSIGPVDLFVIKGILLSTPKVTLEAPAHARAGASMRGRVVVEGLGTSARPTGTVRVRAGSRDLGELAIVDGVAAFTTTAPGLPGTFAITASYAGDAAFAPGVADPAYVAVSKAELAEPVPVGGAWLALVAIALAGFAAARLRRRR